MHPAKLKPEDRIGENTAVLLVGLAGPGAVDYLQFTHASMPAINVRFPESPESESIVAVAVPVGLKALRLNVFTLARRMNMPGAVNDAYIMARTTPMDIARPGAYYIATLHPSTRALQSTVPDRAQLIGLRTRFPAVAVLSAVNFEWP